MDDSHFLVICGNLTDSGSQTILEAAKAAKEYGAAGLTNADNGAYICVIEDRSVIADSVIELGDDTYVFTVGDIRIEMFYSPKHSLVLGINGRDYYVPENEALLLVYNKELNAVVSTRS